MHHGMAAWGAPEREGADAVSHETAMLCAAFCAGATMATLVCWWVTLWILKPDAIERGGGATNDADREGGR